jgi:2-polyprenyl-3-methyl-5-hydroxy-6-metoxy-1,4-benzoquinol methylase
MTATHFSDILRLHLLAEHGGTWIDATVMLSSPRPKVLEGLPFFAFTRPEDPFLLSSWYLQCQPGDQLMGAWRNLLVDYWTEHDDLTDYFVLHHLFEALMTLDPEARRRWVDTPVLSYEGPHRLQGILDRPFSAELVEEVLASEWIHKLTYKARGEARAEERMETVLDHLVAVTGRLVGLGVDEGQPRTSRGTPRSYAARVDESQHETASVRRAPRTQVLGAVEVIGEGVDYLDGAETELLEIMAEVSDRSSGSDELMARIHDWPTKYHLSPQRENLLMPITFHSGMSVLDVGCGTGALTRKIAESGATVVGLEGSYPRAQVAAARVDGLPNARILAGSLTDYVDARPDNAADTFDVIVVCGVLEYSGLGQGGTGAPQEMLREVRQLLKPTGSLLLAIENRWGLKYLLSYPEDHLGQPWIGVEGYWRDNSGVRTWSRDALAEELSDAGFGEQSWFAAYPDYKLPSCLVHESMFDSEDGRALVKQFVRTPTSEDAGASLATADSIAALHSAIDSGLGISLANSFVVICGSPGNLESHEAGAGILAGVPQRARGWRSARVLTRDGRGWRLQHLGSHGPSSSWPLGFRPTEVPVVVGANCEDLIAAELASAGLSSTRLKDLLERWWVEAQAVIPCDGGTSTQFDPMPSNFIIDESDCWHFVDPEFVWHERLDPTMVALRSLAWTAQRVCMRTGSLPGIAPGASVMSVAEALCHLAGIVVGRGTRTELLAFESLLQAKIAGQEDHEHLAAMRGQLEAVLLAPLSVHLRTLPFLSLKLSAERASRELQQTQAILLERSEALTAMEARAQQAETQLAQALSSRRWRYAERIRRPLAAPPRPS